MRQIYQAKPTPAPVFAVSAGISARGVPTPELLQSLLHLLRAHRAPADMRAQVDALIAADELALQAL
jgi:hypothetical protein